jgi:hypothetical protein
MPRAGSVAGLAFRAPLKRNEAPRPTWHFSVMVIDRTPILIDNREDRMSQRRSDYPSM